MNKTVTYNWSIFLSRHNKQESHWGHLLWLHTIDTDQEKGQKWKRRSFSVFVLVLHSLVKQVAVCDFRSGPIIVVHLWSWEVKILFFCLQGIVHSKLPHSLILHNYYSSWSCLLIFLATYFPSSKGIFQGCSSRCEGKDGLSLVQFRGSSFDRLFVTLSLKLCFFGLYPINTFFAHPGSLLLQYIRTRCPWVLMALHSLQPPAGSISSEYMQWLQGYQPDIEWCVNSGIHFVNFLSQFLL